jgi:hypothetical protein
MRGRVVGRRRLTGEAAVNLLYIRNDVPAPGGAVALWDIDGSAWTMAATLTKIESEGN